MTHFVSAISQKEQAVTTEHDAPVTSPDQHKPAPKKALRIGAIVCAVVLVLMTLGNHQGKVEDIFLIASAAGLIFMLIVDWVLRRNGLRS
jgi:hypothetical protein